MIANTLLDSTDAAPLPTPAQWVAVIGGATNYTEKQIMAAYEIGKDLALRGKNVLTGATSGVPYAAAIGAHESGALVAGISPAGSMEQHMRNYCKPVGYMDLIIYSGLSVESRTSPIIRSAAACIAVGGEFGTLNEISAAWLIGNKVIGLLTGHGGVAEVMPDLFEKNKSSWGSLVIANDDPRALVNAVCKTVDSSQNKCAYEGSAPGTDVHEIIVRHKAKQEKSK